MPKNYPFVLGLALLVSQTVQGDEVVDVEQIHAAGQKTVRRIADGQGVAWETRIFKPAATWNIRAWEHAEGWRRDVRVVVEKKEFMIASIIERRGKWYVHEGRSRAIYRPYQAPFPIPVVYRMLALSDLGVADGTMLPKHAEHVDGGKATFRLPVSAGARALFESRIRAIKDVIAKDPQGDNVASLTESMEALQADLDNGTRMVVDVESGIVVQLSDSAGNPQIEVASVKWIGDEAKIALDVSAHHWDDRTADLTDGDRNRLALFLRVMQEDLKDDRSAAPELVVLDVDRGMFRRVPLVTSDTIDGRFLPGRKEVVVAGMDQDRGDWNLYRVNLETGENSLIPNNTEYEFVFPAAVSPDGHRLAASGIQNLSQRTQLIVIDLETNQVRKIGKPMAASGFSWLPDGSGLIFEERGPPLRRGGYETRFVSRIDMDGKVTRLRKGHNAIPLPRHQRILFKDHSPILPQWMTCHMDGLNAELFGDGFSTYRKADIGPDGKTLLMTDFADKKPKPTIIEIDGLKQTRVKLPEEGCWISQSWR